MKKLLVVLTLAICAYSQNHPAACGPMLPANSSACDSESAYLSCYTMTGRNTQVTLATKTDDILFVKVNGRELIKDKDYTINVKDLDFTAEEIADMNKRNFHPMTGRNHCPNVTILEKNKEFKGIEEFQVYYNGYLQYTPSHRKITAPGLKDSAPVVPVLTDPRQIPNISGGITPPIVQLQAGQSIQLTLSDTPPTQAITPLGVFAGTGDLTFCVATKGPTTALPYISVTCRRAGVTKCNYTAKDTGIFSCGDVMWLFNFITPGVINYQASVNDRDPTGAIIGNHMASQGFWSFTPPPTSRGK